MATGLSVNRLIRVQVQLTPLSAARRNFGVLCMAGASTVISPRERIRYYADIESVAQDFGVSAPEYLSAQLFFSQVPRPSILALARWCKTATAALLQGAILTTAEQSLAAWNAITKGSVTLTVGGVAQSITDLDFSTITNLNQVATAITAKVTGAGLVWTGSRFELSTSTAGAEATLFYATAGVTADGGTDISTLLKLTQALALPPVDGANAETPAECALALADISSGWYGLMFADTSITEEQHLNVSAAIEAMQTSHIYGLTVTDTRVLDAVYTADLASQCKALKRLRTFCQYSENPYAIASFFGRAFTVNFNANRSTINMMYKQEPGIVPQYLTETQALTLKTKRCNVFVYYDNDTAILQYGVMSGPAWFDEIHGTDWLQNAVQNECYNLLYTSKTKVPQTDEGLNQFVNTIEAVFGEARNNGLLAPGQWNSDGFGQLERGQYLPKGWYIYAPLMDSQPQSIREQRVAPPLQCAIKLAGAINEIDVLISVNR